MATTRATRSPLHAVLFVSSVLACNARGATSSGDFDGAVGDDAAPDLPTAPDLPMVPDLPMAPDLPTPPDLPITPDVPASACASRVPTAEFCGRANGSCNFAPPPLVACDSGAPYSFYGDDYCAAAATLLIACTEWDMVCLRSAAMITDEVVRPFAGRRVRSLVVLFENASRGAPTVSQCNGWRSRTFPSVPTYLTTASQLGASFPVMASPTFAVVDGRGRLTHLLPGYERMSLTTALEAVLRDAP
jgi:hypothetical protein